jgi:hypothetical protein
MRAAVVVGFFALGCVDREQARLNQFTDTARGSGPAIAQLRSAWHLHYSDVAEKDADRAQERYGKALDESIEDDKEADAWAGADNRKSVYYRHKAAAAEGEANRAEPLAARMREAARKARQEEAASDAAWTQTLRGQLSIHDEEWLYRVYSNSRNYEKRRQAFFILQAFGVENLTFPIGPNFE